jgi:chromosome segregation protein
VALGSKMPCSLLRFFCNKGADIIVAYFSVKAVFMKIKTLEIAGFKSFLDKSTIEFTRGISAIVGPNGCGKSNIIDAIRWVMGEQSVKKLRGKKMEDVIFSGSHRKAPSSFAEVVLTLENDNGSAPEALKDFTEIMISRRIYRSGESAYFLNKRACRLKDIHNIFLGSGMGTRSYSLIQQGNIGRITEAGPEEKRLFVEEAAGISRYKARKKEALQKMASTRQNLDRVNDIISEVGRQMASLKRQAKKAERFQNYRVKAKALDIEISVIHHDAISHEINETASLLESLKDSDLQQLSQIRTLDAAVEKIKINHWQNNQEISNQKAERFELQRQIDNSETGLEHLRKQKELLSDEIKTLESAHLELADKNRGINNEIAEMERSHVELLHSLKTHQTLLEQARESESALKETLSPLHNELEEHKNRLTSLAALEAQYNNIFQTASRNSENIRRRLKRTDEELFTVEKHLADIEKDRLNAESDLQSLKNFSETLSSAIDRLKQTISDSAKDLATQVKVVQSLELSRKECKSAYSALKKMAENFEWFKDGVKTVMKEVKESINQKRPNAVMSPLSDVITADPAYETAVEAVLGEALQYVVVDNQQTAQEALETLGSGRCGFIPVTEIEDRRIKNSPSKNLENAIIPHVSIKCGFEIPVKALLESVAVVPNIADAIFMWNQNGCDKTIVTQTGDVITPSGILIGGSQESLSGILSKKRELAELETRVGNLSEQLQVAAEAQTRLEQRLRQLEIDLQKNIEEKNHTSQKEMEVEKSLFKAVESLKQSNRHREILFLEQEQLMGEQTDTEDEITKYHEEIAKITQEVQETQNAIEKIQLRIQEQTSELEKHHEKTITTQMEMTGITAKLDNSKNTLKRLKDFLQDSNQRLETIHEDISKKKQKLAETLLQREMLENQLVQLYDSQQSVDESLQRNESAYRAAEIKLEENDKAITEIKRHRDKTLAKIQTVELHQSQNKLKREQVEIRLQEKYHRSFLSLKKSAESRENSTALDDLESQLLQIQEKIHRMGNVNLEAVKAYEAHSCRYDFLVGQRDDLLAAMDDLKKVIRKINRISQEKFTKTFREINDKLAEVFPRLFEGGSAKLELTEPDNPSESGVELMIHPPGKKLTRLSLLSGGEKALSAIAFIFSIFLMRPSSFCLLDEIDAPLDDANIYRFNNLLKLIGEKSQIIMITHNKNSMEFSDMLLGVTMENKGISKLASVNLNHDQVLSAAN